MQLYTVYIYIYTVVYIILYTVYVQRWCIGSHTFADTAKAIWYCIVQGTSNNEQTHTRTLPNKRTENGDLLQKNPISTRIAHCRSDIVYYSVLYATVLVLYPNNTGALPHQPIHIRQLHWRIALEVQWEVRKTLSGSMLIIDMQCNPIKTKAMVWKTSARRVEKHEVLNTAHQATKFEK